MSLGRRSPVVDPAPAMPRWVDALAVTWLVVAALAVLAPALAHGASLGPYDALAGYGLTSHHGVTVANPVLRDQIDELLPWTTLAWTQVHHGHLPLWNPDSGLGMPLAFNWQSAPFSVPALVGYAVPLRLDFTVQLLVTLVVAGTGVYLLGRVLHLAPLAAVFGATVFELSGPMTGFLGWPVAGVLSWMGWLAAAVVLVVRGRRRGLGVVLLALGWAAAVVAGEPDVLAVVAVGLAAFAVVLVGSRLRLAGGAGGAGRATGWLVLGVAAGTALSAPLWLPAAQLTAGSVRTGLTNDRALTGHDLVHLLVPGFNGLPLATSQWFGEFQYYPDVALAVGAVGLALAAAAVAMRWRRPELWALAAVAAVGVVVAFVGPVVAGLDRLPGVGAVKWHRMAVLVVFALAVAAGIGLDLLLRRRSARAARWWAGAGFVAVAGLLGGLWLFGRGQLPPAQAAIRDHSFLWPALSTAAGALVVASMGLAARSRRTRGPILARVTRLGASAGGVALLAVETAVLAGFAAPMVVSSPTSFATTARVAALQQAVGEATVGFGNSSCFNLLGPQLGVVPEANDAYGLHELASYDPATPRRYEQAWAAAGGWPAQYVSVFCPAVTSVALARRFGVQYLLEAPGTPGPPGTVLVEHIGDETLYRVPGAAPATVVAAPGDGHDPPPDAPGTPVPVTHPGPGSWTLTVDAARPQLLRLRLSAVPGWHATVDGRRVPLQRWSQAMVQLAVPAGRHQVVLTYGPALWHLGLVLAAGAGVGLVAVPLAVAWRRRQAGR